MKKKLKQKYEKEFLDYLYKEERDYNWQLTELLEQCVPFLPSGKLKEKIESVIKSANV